MPKFKTSQLFTTIILHVNFMHVTSNMLLFALVSSYLEHKYGTIRIVFVSVISGVGGALFSAAFGNPCEVVVGASGMIFGLVGVWMADLVVAFDTIEFVYMRIILATAFFIYEIVAFATAQHVSIFSHLGGLICGFFPGCCFLPSAGHRKVEAFIPFAGILVTVAIFTSLPAYIYSDRRYNVSC